MTVHKTGSVRVSLPAEVGGVSLVIAQRTLRRISRGQAVVVRGEGVEWAGRSMPVVWSFNTIELHSLTVDGRDGTPVHAGTFDQVHIEKL